VTYSLATDTTADSPTRVTTPPPASKRFDLRRVYTAIVLVPAVYAIIGYAPPWALTLLLMVCGCLAVLELYRICFQPRPNLLLTGVGLVGSALVVTQQHLPLTPIELLIGSVAVAVTAGLCSSFPIERRLQDTAITLFGIVYVGFTLNTVVTTRALPDGVSFVFFVALVTWAADTGAYYAGTLWGKHLLAPSISPKKTIEGVLGGLGLATGAAAVAHVWFVPQLSLLHIIVLGLLLTLAGLIGDLFESAIKRRVGVKDSGGILPGHGGMLDRLDSLLFTAPTFYYYVTYIGGISPLR
jgi:phosphatidate cytidylyltransferase